MNWYEQKQADRKERYEQRAIGIRKEADAKYEEGTTALQAIPFGQPILVGHYSEKGDRAYRGRAVAKIDKSFELEKKAEHYERKAEGVGDAGISSDDPDAIVKLRLKLTSLARLQDQMKAANKEKRGSYPAYCLTNNGANMRRIEKRITSLIAMSQMQEREIVEGCGWAMKESIDENRIMFVFIEKPDEATRSILKGRGFKWSPMRGAWVRMLNNAGRYAAEMVIRELNNN